MGARFLVRKAPLYRGRPPFPVRPGAGFKSLYTHGIHKGLSRSRDASYERGTPIHAAPDARKEGCSGTRLHALLGSSGLRIWAETLGTAAHLESVNKRSFRKPFPSVYPSPCGRAHVFQPNVSSRSSHAPIRTEASTARLAVARHTEKEREREREREQERARARERKGGGGAAVAVHCVQGRNAHLDCKTPPPPSGLFGGYGENFKQLPTKLFAKRL